MTGYVAPWWLPGGHLQTIYSAKLVRLPKIDYRRERWETPDGDFIDIDWIEGNAKERLLILFHGLEGDSQSHYSRALMSQLAARRQAGAVVHFRGCSGEANRLFRAYHSGDTEELDWILRQMRNKFPSAMLFAAGVSLGGNALLKWLGATREPGILQGAVAVSAPLDLTRAGRALGSGFNLIYTRMFLKTLKRKVLAKIETDRERKAISRAATLERFDDLYTAPAHGFESVADYWRRSSSKPDLEHIATPTLLINAKNDPFLPASSLPGPGEVSSCVTLEYPETGGHVGFLSGPFPGNIDWLPRRILAFFDQLATGNITAKPQGI